MPIRRYLPGVLGVNSVATLSRLGLVIPLAINLAGVKSVGTGETG
jgi:hypothetical protein